MIDPVLFSKHILLKQMPRPFGKYKDFDIDDRDSGSLVPDVGRHKLLPAYIYIYIYIYMILTSGSTSEHELRANVIRYVIVLPCNERMSRTCSFSRRAYLQDNDTIDTSSKDTLDTDSSDFDVIFFVSIITVS